MNKMNLFGPSSRGIAPVQTGGKYKSLVRGQYFRAGDVVEVTYAGRDKVTFTTSKASVSMLPADFLNSFTAM